MINLGNIVLVGVTGEIKKSCSGYDADVTVSWPEGGAPASYLPGVQSILSHLIPFFDSASIIFTFSGTKSLGFF